MLKILIADDHPIVRNAVRSLIVRHPTWRVCGEAQDGEQALEIARRERPDVAVMGVALRKLSGLIVARHIRDERLGTKVLLLSMYDDAETIMAAIDAGVRAYVAKSDATSALEAALTRVAANRAYLSPAVWEVLLSDVFRPREDVSFTEREVQVAAMVAEGASNKVIAARLGICVKTVETHRASLNHKANVRSAVGLVRFLIKRRLLAA